MKLPQHLAGDIEHALRKGEDFDSFEARLLKRMGVGPMEKDTGDRALASIEAELKHGTRAAWDAGFAAVAADKAKRPWPKPRRAPRRRRRSGLLRRIGDALGLVFRIGAGVLLFSLVARPANATESLPTFLRSTTTLTPLATLTPSSTATIPISTTPTSTSTARPGPTAPLCAGDCNADGVVTVGELVQCVVIAIGNANIEICAGADADGNGRVTISELISGVTAALYGCGVETPTARPTATVTGTITHTPTITPTPRDTLTPTPTATPSPTPAVGPCPFNFGMDLQEAPVLCTYSGGWDTGCSAGCESPMQPNQGRVSWISDGHLVVFVVLTDPPIYFAGTAAGPYYDRATMFAAGNYPPYFDSGGYLYAAAAGDKVSIIDADPLSLFYNEYGNLVLRPKNPLNSCLYQCVFDHYSGGSSALTSEGIRGLRATLGRLQR